METGQAKAAMEAILFASGEPVTVSRLADILDMDPETAVKLLERLAQTYEDRGSGLRIMRLQNSFQICTDPACAVFIQKALDLRRSTPLSQAAFEVLAVVAYNQPVSKAFIEQVRGVDCSGVVGSLVEKGLLEERGRLDAPGRPLLYGTTFHFLRCFGISSLEELPEIENDALEDIPQQEEMRVVAEWAAEQKEMENQGYESLGRDPEPTSAADTAGNQTP